jgi:hypothetical protein|nr:MAG TPA: hypothetical protein [Caudoviricetes sp.]
MSLSIGAHIYEKLASSASLKELVEDKIFPLSTVQETTFPFILYKRNSLVPNVTKDRYATGDNVEVEIVVADNKYLRSVAIAEEVRSLIERKTGEYKMFSVVDAVLISTDESFAEDTFIQRLIFSFETEPNI